MGWFLFQIRWRMDTLLRPRVGTGTYSTSTTTEGASWNDGNKNECFIFSSLARDFGTWFESCVCQHIHCIQIWIYFRALLEIEKFHWWNNSVTSSIRYDTSYPGRYLVWYCMYLYTTHWKGQWMGCTPHDSMYVWREQTEGTKDCFHNVVDTQKYV